jgi:4-hydroxy-tetrahydrodipicolinate reductase
MTPEGKMLIMLAGLSHVEGQGKMAALMATAIRDQPDMVLYNRALAEYSSVVGDMQFFGLGRHEELLRVAKTDHVDVVVDFTLPATINRNAELYCQYGMQFVMGTTGGDRQLLVDTVKKSNISAVIATNMAAPIVMIQEMFRLAAENCPDVLDGYRLLIQESHQSVKLDFSGTAISLLPRLKKLGMGEDVERIEQSIKEKTFNHEKKLDPAARMEREPLFQQTNLGVPKEYLKGHAFHTYTMLSPDGMVKLEFTHNVLGRSVYVDGALRAIRFLTKHKGEKGKVFSMVDVLRG